MSDVLPHVTAALNALAGLLALCGFILIKLDRPAQHRRMMTAAVIASGLFLGAYVLHHFTAPVFVFHGQGIIRPIYFAMLVSHSILAAVVAPMIVIAFLRGRRGQHPHHRRLARWTLPVWIYVSVTGLAVYLMVYHVYRPEV